MEEKTIDPLSIKKANWARGEVQPGKVTSSSQGKTETTQRTFLDFAITCYVVMVYHIKMSHNLQKTKMWKIQEV